MLAEEYEQVRADRRKRYWYLTCLVEALRKLDITDVIEVLDKHDTLFLDYLDGSLDELSQLKQEIIRLYHL